MHVARNDLDVRASALAVRHMGPITSDIGPNDRDLGKELWRHPWFPG